MVIKIKKEMNIVLIISNIVALVSGFIYFFRLNNNETLYIKNLLEGNYQVFNNNLYHIIVVLILLGLSFLIIGIIINYLYLYFEFFTIGFSFGAYFFLYHFNGLAYALIFNIINKLIYLIILIILIKKYNKISLNNLEILITRKRITNYVKPYYQSLIIIFLIIINDLILKFFAFKWIQFFKFIL